MKLPTASFLGLALVLILGVTAISLTLAIRFPVVHFPTIVWACSQNGLAPNVCQSQAIAIGQLVILAYAMAFIVWVATAWLRHRRPLAASAPAQDPDEGLTIVLLTAILCLLAWDAGQMVFGVAFASRLDEADSRGSVVSLQNLAIPLLLQIYLALRLRWLKAVALAALVNAMLLSPYRSMLLSVLGFGFLIPWGVDAVTWIRDWRAGLKPSLAPLGRNTIWLVAFTAILIVAGYIDTASRSPTLLAYNAGLTLDEPVEVAPQPAQPERPQRPKLPPPPARSQAPGQHSQTQVPAPNVDAPSVPGESSDAPGGPIADMPIAPPDNSILGRLAQRATFPFYQAAIAGKIIGETTPPSLMTMVLRKFRLSDAPSLEEFVFRHIYGGEGRNEVTSLSYGEALAYTSFPPWVWMSAMPLLLITACFWLERRGVSAGAIFGMAIWRSSFAGLGPLVPSLILQLAATTALFKLRPSLLRRQAVHRALRLFLLAALIIALVIQAWTLAVEWQRRSLLIVRISLDAHCGLTTPEAIPARLEDVSRQGGAAVRPVLIVASERQALLAFPKGLQIANRFGALAPGIAPLAVCSGTSEEATDQATAANVHFTEVQRFPFWPNPLNMLTVCLFALAVYRVARESVSATHA